MREEGGTLVMDLAWSNHAFDSHSGKPIGDEYKRDEIKQKSPVAAVITIWSGSCVSGDHRSVVMERMTTKDVTAGKDIFKPVMTGCIAANFTHDFTEHNFL